MKKGVSFVWDAACQQAFKNLKKYLMNSLVLAVIVPKKQFLIYVRAMDRALGAILVLTNEVDQEKAIYYISRTIVGAEH